MLYIDASIDFAGSIGVDEIEDLFNIYPIQQYEKDVVFRKLEDIHAEIIYSSEIFKRKLFRLYNSIDTNRHLASVDFEKWIKEENINECMKNKVEDGLKNCGYEVTVDRYVKTKLDKVV